MLKFLQASTSDFTYNLIPTPWRFQHALRPKLPFLTGAITLKLIQPIFPLFQVSARFQHWAAILCVLFACCVTQEPKDKNVHNQTPPQPPPPSIPPSAAAKPAGLLPVVQPVFVYGQSRRRRICWHSFVHRLWPWSWRVPSCRRAQISCHPPLSLSGSQHTSRRSGDPRTPKLHVRGVTVRNWPGLAAQWTVVS